jgi:hypothetical protein
MNSIRAARVIFCPSDKLQCFFDEYENEISARVIISGNSDFDFQEMPSNIPTSVKQLFLQNSLISKHPLVTTLPIGIENFRWGVNGNPRNLKEGGDWRERQNEILIGPFGLTHPTRVGIRNEFQSPVDGITLIPNRLAPSNYAKLANNVRYVAAVRGNGVDTHRHWETLYRGGIPLILRDAWSAGIKHFNFPFIEVDAWNEFELKEITKIGDDLSFKPSRIPALWWPFWKDLIGSYL